MAMRPGVSTTFRFIAAIDNIHHYTQIKRTSQPFLSEILFRCLFDLSNYMMNQLELQVFTA